MKQEIAVGLNKETADLLRDLASKIGVTVDHLWSVLVKQAPIYGWTDLLCGIPLVIGWLFWAKWSKWVVRVSRKDKDKYGEYYDTDGLYVPLLLIGLLLSVLSVFWIFNLSTVFGCLFNPEYWALKQIWKG